MSPSDLSPELVLVAPPELAAQARAALPPRPWEGLGSTDAPALPRDVTVPSAEPAAETARSTAAAHDAARPPSAPPAPTDLALLVLLLASLRELAEQHQAEASRHEISTGSAAEPRTMDTTPGAGARRPTTKRRDRRALAAKALTAAAVLVSTLAAVTWASNRTVPPSLVADPPAPAPIGPIAGAGYVFDGGRFLVAPDRRTLASFELTVACAGRVTIRGVPVKADGSFDFVGAPERGGGTATVSGRIRGASAELDVRLRVTGCPSQPIRRSARVS